MTSTDPVAVTFAKARPPRIIEAVLAISLALNCFFIGGVATNLIMRIHAGHWPPLPPPLPMQMQALSQRIGLRPTDQPAFDTFRLSVIDSAQAVHRENAQIGLIFLQELSQPSPDTARLSELSRQMIGNKVGVHKELMGQLIHFILGLPSDERQTVVRIIGDRNDPDGQALRWIIGM